MYTSGSVGQIVGINNANTTYNGIQILTGASPMGISIDTAGNVGIGVGSASSPTMQSTLDVAGSATFRGTNFNSSSGNLSLNYLFGTSGSVPLIQGIVTNYVNGANADIALTFTTRSAATNAEAMRIDKNGNVGIRISYPHFTNALLYKTYSEYINCAIL